MAWILVIEDDLRMRSIMHDALAVVGYDVLEAATGRDGLAQAQAPDLAVVDVFLPDENGVETLRALRRAWPQLPIVAILGGNPKLPYDVLRIAEGVGASRVLRKPFTLQALYAAIEALLRERR